jgi:para-aminobenzoate synthetase component I
MDAVATLERPWRDPVDVAAPFADDPYAVVLLSGGDDARWSYMARAPEAVFTAASDHPDPFAALQALIGVSPPATSDDELPPFGGGVIGLAAYELGCRAEGVDLPRMAGWPDLEAARYPAVLAFDHRRRRIVACGRDAAAAAAAASWLDHPAAPPGPSQALTRLEAGSGAAYEAAVAEVVSRIAEGEIFQANVARQWMGRLAPGARPFDLFTRLWAQSPAPYAAYMRLPGRALVSNSPERFLAVEPGGRVRTEPIKGTRPRSDDPQEDAALAADLLASAKDRAENLMIVDLMRNDLSRVCTPGTVKAPELFALKSFRNVHHLISTVIGRLRPGVGAAELLRATTPPGSITGAPKVQSMRVIAALEPPRGPFFGSLFWAGADGAMDSSVLIRTAAFTETGGGWRVEARAGAGLVADSQPVLEREETEAKIDALRRALVEPAP